MEQEDHVHMDEPSHKWEAREKEKINVEDVVREGHARIEKKEVMERVEHACEEVELCRVPMEEERSVPTNIEGGDFQDFDDLYNDL